MSEQPTVRDRLKVITVRGTALTLRGLRWLITNTPHWLKPFSPFAIIAGRFFFTALLVPLYKFYLSGKKIGKKFYAPHLVRHRLIHPFVRRYIIHIIMLAIVAVTMANNLNPAETRRDELDQQGIIYTLLDDTDLGTLEEEGPIPGTQTITRYTGTTGIENRPQMIGAPEIVDNEPSTVAGDSAIVRPILSPAEESLRQRDAIVYYTVKQGDTVSQIAEQFGLSVNTILWENNLSSFRVIRPGDTLAILPSSGIRHTVGSGETLSSIAKKYDVGTTAIIDGNKLASADDLRVGEKLFIPGGVKPVVQPTYTYVSYQQPTKPTTSRPEPGVTVTGDGDMEWPSSCRRITQYYRYNHTGVDIACTNGSNVTAADDGTVTKATGGWNGGYGNMIIIDHGNGTQTLYGHLSKLFVETGDTVTKGEVIAAEGSTGRSTGPHLHFEVRVGGARTNPLNHLN